MDKHTEIRIKLAELLSTNVQTKTDLEQWYARAHSVDHLATSSSVELPHLVWHYLADADIRFREHQYGQEQIAAVKLFIESLDGRCKNA